MKIKYNIATPAAMTLFAQSISKASTKFPPVEYSRAHDKNKRLARIANKARHERFNGKLVDAWA